MENLKSMFEDAPKTKMWIISSIICTIIMLLCLGCVIGFYYVPIEDNLLSSEGIVITFNIEEILCGNEKKSTSRQTSCWWLQFTFNFTYNEETTTNTRNYGIYDFRFQAQTEANLHPTNSSIPVYFEKKDPHGTVSLLKTDHFYGPIVTIIVFSVCSICCIFSLIASLIFLRFKRFEQQHFGFGGTKTFFV